VSEFIFFGAVDDRPQVMRVLMDAVRVRVIPDLRFGSPDPCKVTMFQAVDEALLNFIRKERSYFLWPLEDEMAALPLERIEHGANAGKHFIVPDGDASLIHLMLPAHFQVNGVQHLNVGRLSVPEKFFRGATRDATQRSRWLSNCFARLKKALTRELLPAVVGRNIYVGPEGMRLLRQEGAVVNIEGTWRRLPSLTPNE
jgi:hypothetical protein